jgi:hypothetical protein
MLAAFAEFFTHLCWVDRGAGVLYLRAMETENGSREVGREFFQPTYKYRAPVSEVIATRGTTKYRVGAANPYGKVETVSPYHTNTTLIKDQMAVILAAFNALTLEVTLPLENGVPAPNEKIIAVDRKCTPNMNVWCLAQNFSFDFARNTVTVSGKGGVSAI